MNGTMFSVALGSGAECDVEYIFTKGTPAVMDFESPGFGPAEPDKVEITGVRHCGAELVEVIAQDYIDDFEILCLANARGE